jgi:hypothetical protein
LADTNHIKKISIKLSIPYLKSPVEEPHEEPPVLTVLSTGKKYLKSVSSRMFAVQVFNITLIPAAN